MTTTDWTEPLKGIPGAEPPVALSAVSLPSVGDAAPIADATPHKATCETCRWWRDKGWDGDKGTGKCDNRKVDIRLGMGMHFMVDFLKLDKRDAQAIDNSIMFPSDFGCIHHERAPWIDEQEDSSP